MLKTEDLIKTLKGKDMICTQDWKVEELEEVLSLAKEMKKERYTHKYSNCLDRRTFIMMFYNPSVRTRQSFEAAATELGGHAQFIEPKSMRMRTATTRGETIADAARVMARYGTGIGIRILEDAIEKYGDGNKVLREYAQYSNVPIINMADDTYHPCQSLSDVMGLEEHMGDIKKKKLVMHWGYSPMVRSWCSVQGNILLSTRLGMNVTLAYPEGFDLDPNVIKMCKDNASKNGTEFKISHNLKEAYAGADVVYSRNWMSPNRYTLSKEDEQKLYEPHKNWKCTRDMMKLTNNAYFIHPMPVDRGNEVEDEVADSPRSIIVDIAENRLHIQKAIMALTMGNL